ncbi:MAG: rRNA maturation RNase YbeY [Granulosicoccus sp.]|nr:rRNA maturation RNase YbeY [Granulosicoccus sp.]
MSEALIQTCCREALLAPSALDLASVSDVEVSLQWLESAAMRALNNRYRGQDKPTNVLSFAAELPVMVAESEASEDRSSGNLLVLGDLVLCPQVIAQEAAEQGKPLRHHWAHMLVHGTLHLCGYDHERVQEAQMMEDQEIRILSVLGIPDPYAVTNRSE